MKTMKNSNKLLALFLTLLMVVSLAGCNLDSTGVSDDSQASVSDTVSDSQTVSDRVSSDNPTKSTEPTTEAKPSGVGNITATPVEPQALLHIPEKLMRLSITISLTFRRRN